MPLFPGFSTHCRTLALIGGPLLCLFPAALPAQSLGIAGAGLSVNFHSVNVCQVGQTGPAPCSRTLTLNYNVSAGTTIGSVRILTQGTPDLDFKAQAKDTSTTLCAVKTYSSATTCSVDVTFAPIAPGARNGAVVLMSDRGEVLANTYVYGIGTGPAIAFGPGTQITLPIGALRNPFGVATDAAGDLFIADEFGQRVVKVPAGGGAPTTVGSGLQDPLGVAVDGAGSVFIADTSNDRIVEVPAGGGPQTTISVSGLGAPYGVALDGAGDLFISDLPNNRVVELPIGGGPQIVIPANGLTGPFGVAVNGAGDVFIADHYNARIVEVPAGGGAQIVLPFTELALPSSVALDAAGDVFVSDSQNGRVLELPAGGGVQIATPLAGLSLDPQGVAVDGSGDVFIVDAANDRVIELQRSQPPSFKFVATKLDSPSADSPQSVQLQNIGNAPLRGNGVLSDTVKFTEVTDNDTPEDCAPVALNSLAPGAACNLSISFTPQSADPATAAFTFSDDALNGNPAIQKVALSGEMVAPLAQLSANMLSYESIAFPGVKTLPLTITNIGGGTLNIAPSIDGPSYTITESTCGAGVTAGNSCTLRIQFSPVVVGPHDDILTLATNGKTNPTVSLLGRATGVGATLTRLQFPPISYGSTEVLPVTIKNEGVTGTVTLSWTIGGPSYKILNTAQNTCLAGIASGRSCTLPVEFAPVAVGEHEDILTVTSGAGSASRVLMDATAGR